MYTQSAAKIWSCWLLLCFSTVEAATQWQNGTTGPNATTTEGLGTKAPPLSTSAQLTKASNTTNNYTTGFGLEYASECNSAKIDWYLSWGSSLVSTTTFQTSTPDVVFERSTWFTTTTSLAPGATPYTLCDGYTRIDGTTNFSTSVYVTSTTTFSTFETETEVYVNVTAPPCLIQSSDCAYLNSSYSKTSTAYSKWRSSSIDARVANQSFTVQEPPRPSEAIDPICDIPSSIPPKTTSLIPPVCIVNTAHVQLLYWPAKTASDCDICDMGNCRTQTPTPTIPGAPNTAVVFNTTLTSPTVYIVFDGELIGKSDGQSYSDVKRFLVPQSSTAVSSYCGKIGGGIEETPHPFNFAHLNGLVPVDAYRCQPRCFSNPLGVAQYTTTYTKNGSVTTATSVTWSDYATENLCSTIWKDYDPMLSIPPELSTMLFSEASSGCNFTAMPEGILFDPPLALTEAEHADKPTAPAPAPAPAEPTQDAPSPTPKPGATPDTTLRSPTDGPAPEPAEPSGDGGLPQGDENEGSNEVLQSPSSQDYGNQTEAPPPQTTSRNIGDIIASALGMTSAQNNAASEPSPTNSPDQPPVPTAGQAASNDHRPDEDPPNNVNSPAQGPAPVAVLTNSDNQEVPVFQDPTAPVLIVGSTTLLIGETLNVPNVGAVIAQSSGVVVDGSSLAFSNRLGTPAPTTGAVIQGSQGQVFSVAQVPDDRVVVGGSTLAVGETASIAGIGNVVAEPSGIVVDGTSHPFSTIAEPSSPAVITAGSQTFTAGSDGEFTIASGQMLGVGMTTSLPGVGNVVLQSSAVVINGKTHSLSTTLHPSNPGVVTAGDHTFTLGSGGGLLISPDQVLTPGGEITVSGTTYSLDSEGSVAVVNGVPQTVVGDSPDSDQASATTTGDIGANGASSQPNTANTYSPTRPLTQTSIAAKGFRYWRMKHLSLLLYLGLMLSLCV